MRWSSPAVVLAAAWVAGLSAAHNADPAYAAPRILGGRQFLSELKSRKTLMEDTSQFVHRVPPAAAVAEAQNGRRDSSSSTGGTDEDEDETKSSAAKLQERQNKSGRCGAGRGSCAAGYCCSAEGWCGLDADYCTAPDCQLNYGPGCDGNKKPSGADTSKIARPKLGKVQYGGVGIYDCVTKGDIALTFDDGPYNFTDALLDKLAKANAKATFFITGYNLGKGPINDPKYPWRATIQRMAAEGHQIASHTWSHQNFSQMSTTQAQNQMIWNEIALNDILGYFPTYMRPPFSICERACQTMLATLGYHEIYFDLDTEGYLHDDPSQIQTSKDIWDEAVVGSNPCQESYLQIEHDIHYQTVYNLTDYILDSLFRSGYRSVTVGQCLGDPPENWYRAGTGAVPAYDFTTREPTGTWPCLKPTSTTKKGTTTSTTTKPTATPTLKVSPDGACGPGITCQGSQYGNCCSQNGWCGASIDYCGGGCQRQFGTCISPDNTLPADSPLPPVTSPTKLPTGPGAGIPDSPLTTTTTTAPAPTQTLKVSPDGTCGGDTTCQGSEFGNCCSEHGWCGNTADYCGEGCQPNFGSGCSQASEPPTTPTPTPTTPPPTSTTTTSTSTKQSTTSTSTSSRPDSSTTTSTSTTATSAPTITTSTTTTSSTTTSPPRPTALIPSLDGSCGPGTGYTCEGSGFGVCCKRSDGRCGGLLLCSLLDCQPGYGLCIL
ncbi:carbohydrate-binding module family 18 [Apiospora arundinis]|uniref:Carbohydrate-binding module family 18 n=1 Tax=Apiospora arundinis TaxID=335852 RepID=A0ABR2HL52_9PEZI